MFSIQYRKLRISTELALLGFIFTLSLAVYISYNAVFLNQVFSFTKSQIGLFKIYVLSLTILFSFLMTSLIERFDDNKLLTSSLALLILSYIFIGLNPYIPLLFILFFIQTFFKVLRFDTFNLIYKDGSKDKKLSRKEGILFTFINLGWFLGPFIAGLLLYQYPVNYVFYLAAFFTGIGLLLYINLNIPHTHQPKNLHHKREFLKNLKKFFSNKTYRTLFPIAFIYHIWWAFIFAFMPVLITEHGFSNTIAGMFVSFAFLTVMLNELNASKLTEKFSYKRLFFIGYTIPFVAAIAAFLVDGFAYKMAFLIIGSVGYSFIEPIREIFFFEKTSKEVDEEKYYPIFTTCYPVGLLLGNGLFALYFFLPIAENFVFLILAVVMALAFIPISKVRE